MRKSAKSKRGPSQRQLRVGELLRHALVDIITRGSLRDPALADVSITISEVRVDADLRRAIVFCSPLGGDNTDEILAALNKSRSFLRGQVSRAIDIKHTPELNFMLDVSYEAAAHIDELLRSDRVARDLDHREDDVEDID
jgi:ribosome-binding factor A